MAGTKTKKSWAERKLGNEEINKRTETREQAGKKKQDRKKRREKKTEKFIKKIKINRRRKEGTTEKLKTEEEDREVYQEEKQIGKRGRCRKGNRGKKKRESLLQNVLK